MEIEFDPAKDRANVAKHGVSLARARDLSWELAVGSEDTRFDYGERRFSELVPLSSEVFSVTYTQRGQVRRIISLRKANRRERNRYDKDQQEQTGDSYSD
jgi:uncharacterized DUF497 family protein